MCTLALFRLSSPRYPLVVAANRDELYARPAASPARLRDSPGIVAGRDLEAGGTWLGARVHGAPFVAGLLNRRTADAAASRAAATLAASSNAAAASPVRGELSRGTLCLDALHKSSVEEAVRAIRGSAHLARYGPFNLLLADRERAVVLQNIDGLRTTELGNGMSLLTNLDVNDPRCPRLASVVAPFEAVARELASDPDAEAIVARCARVLASHDNSLDPADASPLSRLCVHTEVYGTRSSSLIFVAADGGVRYFHAPGPPCRTAFAEIEI